MLQIAEIQVRAHPQFETELIIYYFSHEAEKLSQSALDAIAKGQEVWQSKSESLQWTVFLKAKSSKDSRVMLARPDPSQRVATLLLNEDHLKQISLALSAHQSFSVNELGSLSGICNLNVRFEYKN
jgi:hypothetical protein